MSESLEKYALTTSIGKQGLIHKVGLIGCGDIGQQVARIVSQSGIDVTFVEVSENRVREALDDIAKQLDAIINRWGLTQGDKRVILSRIKGATTYEAIRDCDLIIELISSDNPLNDRIDMFRELENYVADDTVITSSVSTLMITDIAAGMKHPERALALNFITSPSKVRIVEIVCGLQTNEKSHQTVERFAKMINKQAITVNESPGSVSTRLIVSLINQACTLLMEGVSTISDIDVIMKRGFGMQHGPFELADRIGLDKVLRYMEQLYSEFGLQQFKASPLIKRLVRAHHKGLRSGTGFYIYDEQGQPTGMNVSATSINHK
jgi:3-hydroxybutyryl-CoA dehydrogenase